VATTTNAGFSRVTIVAPSTRIDLALPVDIPFADMLVTLLRFAGEGLADDPGAREGWTLSRLGGVVLDSSRTPGQLEIRDGELLYLRPRGAEPPELAFDDVVDAVATATNERAGRWRPTATRRFGLSLAIVALIGGAAAVLFAGPPERLSGVIGLGGGITLLLAATVASRAFGQSAVGVVLALLSLVYTAVGGLLIGAGNVRVTHVGAAQLLIATAVMLLVAVLAMAAVAHGGPVFLGAAVSAGGLLLATAISFVTGAPAAASAAIVAAVSFAFLPVLPMLAYRLARMPIPSIPTGPDDLKSDRETVDGQRVLARAERTDEFLSALLAALSVIGVVSGLVATTRPPAGLILAVVLGLLMMIRARWFISRRQRLPLLTAGATTLAATLVAVYLAGGQPIRLVAVPGLLVVAGTVGLTLALSNPSRRLSPLAGRLLDIFEVLLIVAMMPLAVWVSGLYVWIRSLSG
jgi:type VII secretion integral membrane protein EccD